MIVRNCFELLAEATQALRAIQRNKKPVRLKIVSTQLYYVDLSYGVTAGFAKVETLIPYEAIRLRCRCPRGCANFSLKRLSIGIFCFLYSIGSFDRSILEYLKYVLRRFLGGLTQAE